MGQDERRRDPNRIPDLERRMDEVARALTSPGVGLLHTAKRHGQDIGVHSKDISKLQTQVRDLTIRLEELRTQQMHIERSLWSRLRWCFTGFKRQVRSPVD